MKPGFSELFKAAQQTVALCEVKPDENVVVYCDTRQNPVLSWPRHFTPPAWPSARMSPCSDRCTASRRRIHPRRRSPR